MMYLTKNSPIRDYDSAKFSELLEGCDSNAWANEIHSVIWANSPSYRRNLDFGTYGNQDKAHMLGLVKCLMADPDSLGFRSQNAYLLLVAFTKSAEQFVKSGVRPNAIHGLLFSGIKTSNQAIVELRSKADRWDTTSRAFTVGTGGTTCLNRVREQSFAVSNAIQASNWADAWA